MFKLLLYSITVVTFSLVSTAADSSKNEKLLELSNRTFNAWYDVMVNRQEDDCPFNCHVTSIKAAVEASEEEIPEQVFKNAATAASKKLPNKEEMQKEWQAILENTVVKSTKK